MGESILKKIELLDGEGKKQLSDFLDFLLFQQKSKHVQEFDYNTYRQRILTIGSWSDSDVSNIEAARQGLNNWQVRE